MLTELVCLCFENEELCNEHVCHDCYCIGFVCCVPRCRPFHQYQCKRVISTLIRQKPHTTVGNPWRCFDFGRKSSLLPIPKRSLHTSAFQSTQFEGNRGNILASVFDDLSSSGYFNASTQKVINYVNPSRDFLVVFSMTFDTDAVCLQSRSQIKGQHSRRSQEHDAHAFCVCKGVRLSHCGFHFFSPCNFLRHFSRSHSCHKHIVSPFSSSHLGVIALVFPSFSRFQK